MYWHNHTGAHLHILIYASVGECYNHSTKKRCPLLYPPPPNGKGNTIVNEMPRSSEEANFSVQDFRHISENINGTYNGTSWLLWKSFRYQKQSDNCNVLLIFIEGVWIRKEFRNANHERQSPVKSPTSAPDTTNRKIETNKRARTETLSYWAEQEVGVQQM